MGVSDCHPRAIPKRNRFSETWRPAAERAGLPPGTGFHAVRHYYTSLLIRHGESPTVVQARLGHASVTQTQNEPRRVDPAGGGRLCRGGLRRAERGD
jgi:integrase